MTRKIFNEQALSIWKEVDNDRWQEIVREIVTVFLSSCPETYGELLMAAKAKDRIKIRKVAHSLKSSFGNVAAERAHEVLWDIERVAESASEEVLQEKLEFLEEVYKSTILELQNFLRKKNC